MTDRHRLAAPAQPSLLTLVKKHIITVDDETVILELLQQFLSNEGYRVTTATSAAEALKIARADPPQLVITDLQLEDSDGLQMVEQLKRLFPDIPVILLTGVLFDPKVVEASISKKVAAYISKTSPLENLAKEVRRLIGP